MENRAHSHQIWNGTLTSQKVRMSTSQWMSGNLHTTCSMGSHQSRSSAHAYCMASMSLSSWLTRGHFMGRQDPPTCTGQSALSYYRLGSHKVSYWREMMGHECQKVDSWIMKTASKLMINAGHIYSYFLGFFKFFFLYFHFYSLPRQFLGGLRTLNRKLK